MTSPTGHAANVPAESAIGRGPIDLAAVRVFLIALSALLAGYMFMGRGFAHLGMHPIYVGEVVLLIGLICSGVAIVRLKLRFTAPPIVWLLVAFMLLGAARTFPFLGDYGFDALRDGVLWGYALFALMVYVLADRRLVLGAMRLYGWVVPVFALWLPVCWTIFVIESPNFDPNALGSFTPLVFFKAGDMATHAVGSVAFLVLAAATVVTARMFLWRVLVALPLTWTTFVTATASRGALLASIAGYGAVVLFAPRSRNWIPVLVATAILVVGLVAPTFLGGPGAGMPSPTPIALESPTPSAASPTATVPGPSPTSVTTPTQTLAPEPTPAGRSQDISQLVENFVSVFGGSDGTRAFRLAWWKAIVDYTVFGPYFWTGKGFGINLADADGFQPTADHSLRAPHNSHISTLARMGVPGFVLWILLQGAFGAGLLRSVLAHRRAGDRQMAIVGAWILVYWTAMMVITTFDPYLEGPQGGIWFWTLFGLGLVVMRLTPRPSQA